MFCGLLRFSLVHRLFLKSLVTVCSGDKCDDLAEEGGVYCTRHRNVTNRRLNDNRHEALARRMAYLEETMTLINDKMDIMMSYSFIPAGRICEKKNY